MKKLHALLDQTSEEKIKEAIRLAEMKTSAEIVPMIVWSSSPIFHIWPLLFLLFSLISAIVFPLLPLDVFFPVQPWGLVALNLILVVGLSLVCSRLAGIQNFLTPDWFEKEQVHQRALLEFYQAQMDQTLAKTGVLLFVSIRERRAVVLADSAISAKVPEGTWSEIIASLTQQAKKTTLTDGIVNAVKLTGEKLRPMFPRSPTDTNELPDRLIIKF